MRYESLGGTGITLSQLDDLLAGAEVELGDDVLGAIIRSSEIVNTPDAGYVPPSLEDAALRRRPSGSRSAG